MEYTRSVLFDQDIPISLYDFLHPISITFCCKAFVTFAKLKIRYVSWNELSWNLMCKSSVGINLCHGLLNPRNNLSAKGSSCEEDISWCVMEIQSLLVLFKSLYERLVKRNDITLSSLFKEMKHFEKKYDCHKVLGLEKIKQTSGGKTY